MRKARPHPTHSISRATSAADRGAGSRALQSAARHAPQSAPTVGSKRPPEMACTCSQVRSTSASSAGSAISLGAAAALSAVVTTEPLFHSFTMASQRANVMWMRLPTVS